MEQSQNRNETDGILGHARRDEEQGALPTYYSRSENGKGNSLVNVLSLSVHRTKILMERSLLNYRRNLLAYGIRVGMYGMFFLYHPHPCASGRSLKP